MAGGHPRETGKPLVNREPFLEWEVRSKTKLSKAGKGGNAQCRLQDSGTQVTREPAGLDRLPRAGVTRNATLLGLFTKPRVVILPICTLRKKGRKF